MQSSFNRNNFMILTLVVAPFFTSVLPVMAQKGAVGKRAVKGGSWVDLQVSTNTLKYTAGEPIQVTLKATNTQHKDAYLKFSSGQRFDFKVFKVGGKEPVYVWSATKMFTQATSTIKLKMGERQIYNAEIGSEMDELAPGRYRLEAHLTNSSQIRALPIEFAIVGKSAVPSAASEKAQEIQTITAKSRLKYQD
ncbi:MAG: hypothetical protein KY445_09740 [Armatimonadetes bacterium]|nr:hypothetical protein [Armatimonadota bacterium]